MVLNYLNSLDIKILILSRGRSETITTHKILPFATLCVPKSEYDNYYHTGLDIVTVPDEIKGLGYLRNWVLEHFKEEIIVMADDDISHLWLNSRKRGVRISDPETILQIIYNTAQCAKDLGTSCFGFSQAWDVRKYDATQPFQLDSWVGGVVGVVGRDIKFLEHMFKVDIDFCLRTLMKDRIIWRDNRYAFVQERDRNKGGNSLYRTADAVEKELTYLEHRWGKYFKRRISKAGEITNVKVERKNQLS